jgi:hypothetical protein
MAINFTLAEVTPHRLRYLCLDDGDATVTPSTGQIGNTGAGTPDLRADAAAIHDSPIHKLVSTAVTSQADARKLLAGEGLTTDADIDTPRAHLKLTPKNTQATQIPWAVDADLGVGGSAGYAVINVYGSTLAGALCFLDVEFEHTITR